MKKRESKIRFNIRVPKRLNQILLIVLIFLGTFNIFLLSNIDANITANIVIAEEDARPANLEIVRIIDSSCTDCYNIGQIISLMENSASAEIIGDSTIESSSGEAQTLINRYGIEKIPTVVVTGETEKSNIKGMWSQFGEIEDDGTVIFRELTPVYIDTGTDEAVGRVYVTHIIDSSCKQCTDLSGLIKQFQDSGVTITAEFELDYTDDAAQQLIEKYNITTVPTFVLSKDAEAYSNIRQSWSRYGTVESDGVYVMREVLPPYVDPVTGETKGLVTLIMLDDSSCEECYDVKAHKGVLSGFGVSIVDESTENIDSETGEALLAKYNITKVPTILLSPEVDIYSALKEIWRQVGTVEEDGWFVFRSTEQMGSYTNLQEV